MKPAKITIHCSASPNFKSVSIEEIKRWHLERGFSDVGYHLTIDVDGTVEKGRPLNVQGAHVKGHNKDNVGICLIGTDQFTKAQFQSLRYQLDSICMVYNIPKYMIFCHNQFERAKTCPGFSVNELLGWYLTNDLKALKNNII